MNKRWPGLLFAAATASIALGGCLDDLGGDDDGDTSDLIDTSQFNVQSFATKPGVNSDACTASPFNCRFHDGDSRVLDAAGLDTWAITPGASVRDGDGNVLATETGTVLTFNFGQTRTLAGTAHALALTTSNSSAGWYPFDHIVSEDSFRARVGNVDAKDPGRGKLACYEIADYDDAQLAVKKVVYNSQEPPTGHERAGDYLPLVRADGKRSANLIFSVPGFGLGGATTDHFQSGAKFQRVQVPTTKGPPSISIPLYVQNSHGAYTSKSGTMRFLYGYVRASDGTKRFGWMAEDALDVSSGCD
jgi:hypothetical protein|nr:hypothetical protein [Kofleriaceae bacterium]